MHPNDASDSDQTNRDAAAKLARDKLDSLYNDHHAKMQSGDHATAGSHHAHDAQAAHMQQYHTQWQNYYQKYYEQYYVGHLHQALKEQQDAKKLPEEKQEEAVSDIRQKILTSAKEKARNARKSRHFIPVMSALVVVFVVAFLQYNEVVIGTVQAYVSPGAINPQNIVVDPTANVKVSPEPKLIIPKINVDVPVVYGYGYDHDSQMKAMAKGVAHFAIPGANSVPGQVGNTVFAGHSSNDLFDSGDYKFIFVQLEKLELGDMIYVNYDSVRYTYTVTKKEVVKPTEVSKLTYPTTKPVLTLITCVPIGTANKRLLVTAEQISPDPAKAAPASQSSDNKQAAMPGNGPTALERLFGAR